MLKKEQEKILKKEEVFQFKFWWEGKKTNYEFSTSNPLWRAT